MSFLITSLRKSAPSETLSSSKPNCLPWNLFRWKSLANFWVCHWWICLKNNQQCIYQIFWTWSHSHHASLWKHLHPLADYHEHHQHISYHWHYTTWSEDSHRQIFWKTTVPFLTFHFCPKFWKKSFSTNISPISKKTASAIPFSQPVEQDTALRPFCYVL